MGFAEVDSEGQCTHCGSGVVLDGWREWGGGWEMGVRRGTFRWMEMRCCEVGSCSRQGFAGVEGVR